MDIRYAMFSIKYELIRFVDKAYMSFVWMLPHKLIYLALIRGWANATTGEFSTIDVGDVSMKKAIEYWSHRRGGNFTKGEI